MIIRGSSNLSFNCGGYVYVETSPVRLFDSNDQILYVYQPIATIGLVLVMLSCNQRFPFYFVMTNEFFMVSDRKPGANISTIVAVR